MANVQVLGKDEFGGRHRSLWQMPMAQQQVFAAAIAVGPDSEHRGYTPEEAVERLYAAGFAAWGGDVERGGKVGRPDWRWLATRSRLANNVHTFEHTELEGRATRCTAHGRCGASARSRGDKEWRVRYNGGSPLGSPDKVRAQAVDTLRRGVKSLRAAAKLHGDDDIETRIDVTPSMQQALSSVGYDSVLAMLAEEAEEEATSRESAAPGRMLPRARRYWALLANPDLYRVEAAVSERDEGWWTTGQSEMLPGDGVIVWKGRGRKRSKGGIVAFGTVLTEPETRAGDDDPFWLDSERSRRPERRVLVRYELAQRLPLWADAPGNEALPGLSVARSRGRSVFRVTGEQWSEIAALAELTTERDSDGTAQVKRALSRMPDAARNAAVERRAMEEAARHYREAGWEVEDVSSRRGLGYDIRCTRNGEELRVEVKGVSTDGSEVHLTRNEVDRAREYPRPVLFVVSGIEVSYADGGSPAASGGQARILDPWRIGDGELTALAYSYRLPADS